MCSSDLIQLKFHQAQFTLVGVSDYWEGPHDVSKALVGVDLAHPVILVTHNPDIFPDLPDSIDLAIAGHTHGGQVAVPWWGRPIVPSQFGERYAIGHIVESDRHLFVSPGIGTSILPVRFRVPPEVSVVTISSLSRREMVWERIKQYASKILHHLS